MSYIRCSTNLRLRKGERKDDEFSLTYAYGNGRHVCISNGWRRTLELLTKNVGKKRAEQLMAVMPFDPEVHLTDAEMRYMCQSYLSRDPYFKKLGIKPPTPAPYRLRPGEKKELDKLFKPRKRKMSKTAAAEMFNGLRRKALTKRINAMKAETALLEKELQKYV